LILRMETSDAPTGLVTDLSHWRISIDRLLAANRPDEALRLLPILSDLLPRYLPTYVQILHAFWMLRRWREGRIWALRLLRADPTQELAWALLAYAAEEEGKPSLAQRYWLLAFEQAPYSPAIRAGAVRTSLGQGTPLTLNRPALATLYRQGRRWQKAARLYADLVAEHPTRPDFQHGWLESLWQTGQGGRALPLARSLVQKEPNFILGWLVSAEIGDDDDRALAQAPLAVLDADGAYVLTRFGIHSIHTAPSPLPINPEEGALLQEVIAATATATATN
jgi:tetratricopeptide (TPR) repeat protein